MDSLNSRDELTMLSASLRQIASKARDISETDNIPVLMRECELKINEVAPKLEVDIAAELVDMLRMLGLWRSGWSDAQQSMTPSRTLSVHIRLSASPQAIR